MKLLPLLATALAGCYATASVPVEAMRGLAGGFDGPKMVKGQRLDPGTMIRAQLTDGTETGWFGAGGLRLSDEGLMVEEPRPSDPGPRTAAGLRWSEVRAFRLRSLSPEFSALAVPFFPYVLLAGAVDKNAFDRVTSSTDGEGEREPPDRLWSDAPTRPLFTWEARRRNIVKGLATADVQASYRGDFAAGLAAGLRFRDFWEFAFVARPMTIAGVETGGGRANVVGYGGSMGLHIAGDSDARVGFYLGAELVGRSQPEPFLSAQFKWGPRLRLPHGLFLSASPLTFAHMDVGGTSQRPAWSLSRVITSVELGGTL